MTVSLRSTFIFTHAFLLICGYGIIPGEEPDHGASTATVFIITPGLSDNGLITPAWEQAIANRHDRERLAAIAENKKQFSEDERDWAALIRQSAETWPARIDSLCIPFEGIEPPDSVWVLLGNQGGADAFVYSLVTICFDLSELLANYGAAAEPLNRDRIDRFFAHEFTHLLHKAWREKHQLALQSPLDQALWECLTEGLGNYRSLSGKWLQENGHLSEHAEQTLSRLQPIFVARISALAQSTEEESVALMSGLSMGPFEQKWGALTTALWLSQEVQGDERNLRHWVEAGPPGVLILAKKYLPPELAAELPPVVKN